MYPLIKNKPIDAKKNHNIHPGEEFTIFLIFIQFDWRVRGGKTMKRRFNEPGLIDFINDIMNYAFLENCLHLALFHCSGSCKSLDNYKYTQNCHEHIFKHNFLDILCQL